MKRMKVVFSVVIILAMATLLPGCLNGPGLNANADKPIVNGPKPVIKLSQVDVDPAIRINKHYKTILVKGGDGTNSGLDVAQEVASLLPTKDRMAASDARYGAAIDIRIVKFETKKDIENAPQDGKMAGQAAGDFVQTAASNGNPWLQAFASLGANAAYAAGTRQDEARTPILYYAAANIEVTLLQKKGPPRIETSVVQCLVTMVPSTFPPSAIDDQAAKDELRQKIIGAVIQGML